MKNILFVFAIVVSSFGIKPPLTGKLVLKKMHDRYAGKWYKTLFFNQTTEIYRNDSLVRSETWHEHIQFPQNFRIDFGNPDSGNAVIFKNDSSVIFRNSKKIKTNYYPNDLLFLLGGMYFYPFEESVSKIASFGFDPGKFHEDVWKDKKVYVIGAEKKEDSVSQVWFDTENYNLVRMIKFENKQKEEALFENHVKLNGGFSETLVYFYVNNKLVQVEKYYGLKADIRLNTQIFDPVNFTKIQLQ
jgi:hypothetical protein